MSRVELNEFIKRHESESQIKYPKPDGSFGGIVYIGLKTDYFLSFYQKIDIGQQQFNDGAR